MASKSGYLALITVELLKSQPSISVLIEYTREAPTKCKGKYLGTTVNLKVINHIYVNIKSTYNQWFPEEQKYFLCLHHRLYKIVRNTQTTYKKI